ncbi:hypothetical protein B0H16DRAFT_1561963 [Mycena metata]|uniref:DUF202 domain-containing protein n=1 Tax=Mycena metata TaxID=1033252 RepID=A0AAD7IJN5_9AGAR|nr:hypothetical protein B0H16DRAFT_1561963 [Mycena metata]
MNEDTFSEHAPSPSTSSFSRPLVVHKSPRPSIVSRLSQTMSQAMESPAPHTLLAPPGSPHDLQTEAVEDSEISRARNRPVASHANPSSYSPLVDPGKVSLVLENSGSVARDHLASERTFLAYVRTSLVIASTGVALVQLFTISSNTTTDDKLDFVPTARRIQAWARPLGATMVCFGLVVLTLGTIRYFRIQSALTQGLFPVARLTAASITLILGTIIVVLFAILLSARG